MKSAYEMRPHEILEAREKSSCAFIPIAPCFEWHSYHLPLGTDGLIGEGICREIAERVNGIYFKPLSFGLDAVRTEDELKRWGFTPDEYVYGMRFPDVPLFSEYCSEAEMEASLKNRIEAVKKSGFKYIFIVNAHGGQGQFPLVNRVADELDSEAARVISVNLFKLMTYDHPMLNCGGHAGQSETLMLMAFYPELVDLSRLPEGELKVREFGILHDEPVIPDECNPRHLLSCVANELKHNIINNLERIVVETVKK